MGRSQTYNEKRKQNPIKYMDYHDDIEKPPLPSNIF